MESYFFAWSSLDAIERSVHVSLDQDGWWVDERTALSTVWSLLWTLRAGELDTINSAASVISPEADTTTWLGASATPNYIATDA